MLTNLIDTYKKNLDELNSLSKEEHSKPEVQGYIKLLKKVIKDLNSVQSEIGQVPNQNSSNKTKTEYNKMISGYGFYYGGTGIPAQYSDTDNQVDSGSGSDANVMGESNNIFGDIDWTDPKSINIFFDNKPRMVISSNKSVQQAPIQQPIQSNTSFMAESIVDDINKYHSMLDSTPDIEEEHPVQQAPIQQPNIQQAPIQQPNIQQRSNGDSLPVFDPNMWTKPDAIKDIMKIDNIGGMGATNMNMNPTNMMTNINSNVVLNALSKNASPAKIEQNNQATSELAKMLQQAQNDAQKFVGPRLDPENK